MSLLRHSAQYYFVISQLRFQFGYSRFNERGSTPVLFPPANVDYKIFQKLGSVFTVEHFRVELYSPYFSSFI